MHLVILALIVLLCVCVAPLIFDHSWQGRQPASDQSKLQPDTFRCMHCAARKPLNELSTTINRMCQECVEMYEAIQDEP